MYREISVKNMVWYVLKRWRLMLSVIVVFAVAFGAWQYRIDKVNAETMQTVVEPTPQEIRDSLSDNEIREIGVARDYAVMMEAMREYNENSIIPHIPFNKEIVVTMQYGIQKEDGNTGADSYFKAFQNYITSGQLGTDIVSELGLDIDPQYITELISYTENSQDIETVMDNIGEQKTSFVVKIIHYSEDEAQKIAEKADRLMSAYAEKLKQQIGDFSFVKQSENSSVVTDEALYNKQAEIASNCDTSSGKYLEWYGKLSANQLFVYDNWDELMGNKDSENVTIESDREETETTDTASDDIKVSLNKIKIILGAFVGLFLSVLCLMVYYIGTGTLRDTSDFENLSVNVLGEVDDESKKHKLLGKVDEILHNLQYRNEKGMTEEQRIEVLSAAVAIKCEKKDIHDIFFMGENKEGIENNAVQKLVGSLEKKNIVVHVGENLIRNAEALQKASQIKNIIMIGIEDRSCFDEIKEMVRICNDQEFNILGGILVRA